MHSRLDAVRRQRTGVQRIDLRMPPFPFSVAELVLALSLAMPQVQAERLAQAMVGENHDDQGWSLSVETWVLLSLASPQLEEKVATVLDSLGVTFAESVWSQAYMDVRSAIELNAGSATPPDDPPPSDSGRRP